MPRKLGQHFLHRQDLLCRIAEAAYEDSPERIIEIGPGRGALTAHLLKGPARITAIEVDPLLIPHLEERFGTAGNFELIHADILGANLAGRLPAVVAGNLPYYITSPIVEKVLSLGQNLQSAVFLMQKEVADRLCAGPGSRDFGYLSVQTQLFSEPKTLFRVPPSAFRPPPKVDSAVIRLKPRPEPPVSDVAGFLKFASACFRQKRKTLRNNLKPIYAGIAAHPEAGRRAEQLSLEALIGLFERLESSDNERRERRKATGGFAMADLDSITNDLKRMRDEVELKIGLGSMEAKQKWEELEGDWKRFAEKAELKASSEDVDDALGKLADEIKRGYERLKKAL